ncbi:Hypothetical predicted protein [Olea europaea subsp. europaea]|nr:Hypothetical predicted protein [Olea europaea subsp. europaea]
MTRLCSCSGSFGCTRRLNSERNQLAEASCKTCGGKFLADGIELVSDSMLETVGPEVMNSNIPELNWKTVTKGRRSKKPVVRNLKVVAKVGNTSPKRVGNFSGSDSDKFGEAGFGQRSSSKVEHVPIKKRRNLLRSPSPNTRVVSIRSQDSSSPQTRTSSPISEDFEQLSDQNHSSGYGSLNSYSNQLSRDFDRSSTVKVGKGVDHGISLEGTEAVLYSSEDFSGIELLAAAACINGMDDDVVNANKEDLTVEDSSIPECSVASTCPTELKVGFTCTEAGNFLSKESVYADSFQSTLVPDKTAPPQNMLESVKDGAVQRAVSSKVDRLHWDLNTVMDAWDEPYDVSDVGNTSKDIDDFGILGGKLKGECCGDHKKCDVEVPRVEFFNMKKEVTNLEELSDSDKTCLEKKCFPKPERCLLEPVNSYADMGESMQIDSDKSHSVQVVSPNSDVDTSIKTVDKDAVPNNSTLAELPCSLSISEPKEKLDGTSGFAGIFPGEYCFGHMIEFNKTTCSEAIPAGIQNLTSNEVPVLELSMSVNDTEDSRKTSELPDIRTSLKETMSLITCERPDIDNSGSNSTDVDFSHPSSNCRSFRASGTFIPDDQSVAIADRKGQDDRVSVAGSMISDSQGHFKPQEIVVKHEDDYVSIERKRSPILQDLCNSYGGGENVDPNALDAKIGIPDDCHDSDVSQDNHGQMVDGDEVTKFQAGYDSPYEDGELRGSVLYSWEDNAVEYGENECVDYDSDVRDGNGSDAADYPGSDIVDGGSEGSQGAKKKFQLMKGFSETDLNKVGSVKHYWRHFTNNETEKAMGGKIESNAGSGTTIDQSVEMVAEEYDDSERRRVVDRTDAVDGKGLCMDEFGSRTSRGKLQSRIEGPSSLVATDGKDVFMQQCRSRRVGGPYSRSERNISPEKYPLRYRPASHVRGRDGCDSQWTYWGSRNHYTSRYHGMEDHSHTRPRNAINDSTNKFGGFDSHEQRQSANYSSRGSYRPSFRRRSPVDRDDYFGIHRRVPLARGTSNNRSEVNSGNYSRRVGREIREDFHEPVPDDAPRLPNYLSRRENSFAHNPGRGSHISLARRKSCSRSRSRSPRPWNLHKERNMGTRQYSRSPDFRSNVRTERTRLPYSKPSFASDNGEGYMSPPRGYFSPQRNCQWVGERNFMDNCLRHRRSPVRMFRRNERFDTVGSSGRMKSDNSFRPTTRPGRFSFTANYDREFKFKAGYEDRIHRVRLSDDDGPVRRFPHDVSNNFDASNNSNKENDVQRTDQRDVPRNARDGKRSFNI